MKVLNSPFIASTIAIVTAAFLFAGAISPVQAKPAAGQDPEEDIRIALKYIGHTV